MVGAMARAQACPSGGFVSSIEIHQANLKYRFLAVLPVAEHVNCTENG